MFYGYISQCKPESELTSICIVTQPCDTEEKAYEELVKAEMEMLYKKHKTAIEADPEIKASFFLKKATNLFNAGKNPIEELKIIYECQPTVKNLLRLVFTKLHLYGFVKKIKWR